MPYLYYHPLSTFSRRVRVALLEKQIEHAATVVDMATGEHRKPTFLALSDNLANAWMIAYET
jgi:glutathione S-transferase